MGSALRLLLVAALAAPAAAQDMPAVPLPDTTGARYASSAQLAFVLSEYGLGAGGALRAGLGRDLSLVAELSVGAGRDEREQQFFVDFFGTTETPFKRNYVLLVPLHVGLERRLFREQIEDNFRPFAHVSVGPSLGYQWPYFDDRDGDGVRAAGEAILSPTAGLGRGEARLGVGGAAGLGAHFGRDGRSIRTFRFGVQGTYFPAEIELLEALGDRVERPNRKAFWTPVISFHVGRLL